MWGLYGAATYCMGDIGQLGNDLNPVNEWDVDEWEKREHGPPGPRSPVAERKQF